VSLVLDLKTLKAVVSYTGQGTLGINGVASPEQAVIWAHHAHKGERDETCMSLAMHDHICGIGRMY
jgi:hypothetical protein